MLLVATVAGRQVHPLLEQSKQTRLGQGFYDTHQLQPAAIEQTAKAVADFARIARESGAASIKIIATSAARDAVNKEELVAALETERSAYQAAARVGDYDTAVVWAGEAVDLINSVESAATLVARISAEAEARLRAAGGLIRQM